MSESVSSIVLRRHIGRRFEALRKRAGLTVQQASQRIDKGRSTLMRIEQGDDQVRYRVPDVEKMLQVYGASDKESEILLALTAQTRNGGNGSWWLASSMPSWFELYVALEDAATQIRHYETEIVPGLLQSPGYAEALFRENITDEEEIERLLEVRMGRHSLLDRDRPPNMTAILNEAVLRQPVGGASVMAAQLRLILDVDAAHTNVTVLMLPFGVGAHAGMGGSAFTMMDFPAGLDGDQLEPPMAYIDTFTEAVYANEPGKIERYRRAWENLTTKTLDAAASRELITKAMEEFAGG